MRYVDADKLYPDCMTKNGTLAISQSQIANAPTVCGNNPKWCESCVSKGKCASTRPQGEWIGNAFDEHYCKRCGHPALWEEESDGQYYEVRSNFCPNCGEKMKGGTE